MKQIWAKKGNLREHSACIYTVSHGHDIMAPYEGGIFNLISCPSVRLCVAHTLLYSQLVSGWCVLCVPFNCSRRVAQNHAHLPNVSYCCRLLQLVSCISKQRHENVACLISRGVRRCVAHIHTAAPYSSGLYPYWVLAVVVLLRTMPSHHACLLSIHNHVGIISYQKSPSLCSSFARSGLDGDDMEKDGNIWQKFMR